MSIDDEVPENNSEETQQENAEPEVETPTTPPETATEVSGHISKGPVDQATINVFQMDGSGNARGNTLLQLVSDVSGNFLIDNIPSQNVLLVSSGGQYVDEADEADVPRTIQWQNNEGLESILLAGQSTAVITILTDALVQKTRRESRGGNFQLTFAANRSNAIEAFGFDPFKIVPAHPTRPSSSSSVAQQQYALVIGGLANSINRIAIEMGYAAPPFSVVTAVITDLSDGQIDGLLTTFADNQASSQPIQIQNSAGQLQSLPTDMDLNAEIRRFYNNNSQAYRTNNLPVVNQTTLSIPIALSNQAPSANNDTYTVNRNQPLVVNAPGLIGNDSDPENLPLFAEIVQQPEHGNIMLNADGSFEYTLTSNNVTQDSFTYRVSDSSLLSDAATVNLVIANTGPVIESGVFEVNENSAINTLVGTINVNDPDNDPVELNLINAATLPFVINDAGEIRLAGSLDFETINQYELVVIASDSEDLTATTTIDINVLDINEPPVAENDNYSLNKSDTLTVEAPGLLTNDSDPENSQLSITLVTQPQKGTLTFNTDGSFSYAANSVDITNDQFTYSITDDNGQSDSATVNLTLLNNRPFIDNQTVELEERDLIGATRIKIVASDPDGDPLDYTITSEVDGGYPFTINTNGKLVLTQPLDFEKQPLYVFALTVTDTQGLNSTGIITFNVLNEQELVEANNDHYLVDFHSSTLLNVADNDRDPEGDDFVIAITTESPNGAITTVVNNQIQYTAPDRFVGVDQFTYRACNEFGFPADGQNQATILCSPATVEVEVRESSSLSAKSLSINENGESLLLGDRNHALAGDGETVAFYQQVSQSDLALVSVDIDTRESENIFLINTSIDDENNGQSPPICVEFGIFPPTASFYGDSFVTLNRIINREEVNSNDSTFYSLTCQLELGPFQTESVAITTDGRVSLFLSNDPRYPAHGTENYRLYQSFNATEDVYLVGSNAQAQPLTPISTDPDGAIYDVKFVDTSADGKWIVFSAENPHQSNGFVTEPTSVAVFLKNTITGSITTPPRPFSTANMPAAVNNQPRISDDGKIVVFRSASQGFVEETTFAEQWYAWDTQANTISLISANARGNHNLGDLTNNSIVDADISGDGRYFIFKTRNGQLIGTETTNKYLLHIKALTLPIENGVDRGEIAALHKGIDARPINQSVSNAQISFDGKIVSFTSHADNIDATDNNIRRDVFAINNPFYQPVSSNRDYDNDGLTDSEELALGTLPMLADSDKDGLSDNLEVALGSNPLQPDSDADGLNDGLERRLGGSLLEADHVITVDSHNGNDNNQPPYSWQNSLATSNGAESELNRLYTQARLPTDSQVYVLYAPGNYQKLFSATEFNITIIGGMDPSTTLSAGRNNREANPTVAGSNSVSYLTTLSGSQERRALAIAYSTNLTVEDLTLTDGFRDASIEGANHGTGLYVFDSGKLTLRNLTIENNHSLENGGGIYLENIFDAQITNTSVIKNRALTGGALAAKNVNQIALNNNLIAANSTQDNIVDINIVDIEEQTNIVLGNNVITANLASSGHSAISINSFGASVMLNNAVWGNRGSDFSAININPRSNFTPEKHVFAANSILMNRFANPNAFAVTYGNPQTLNSGLTQSFTFIDNALWFNNVAPDQSNFNQFNSSSIGNNTIFDSNAIQDYQATNYGTQPVAIEPQLSNLHALNYVDLDSSRNAFGYLQNLINFNQTGINTQSLSAVFSRFRDFGTQAVDIGYRPIDDTPIPASTAEIVSMTERPDFGTGVRTPVDVTLKIYDASERAIGSNWLFTAASPNTTLRSLIGLSDLSNRVVLSNLGKSEYTFSVNRSSLAPNTQITVDLFSSMNRSQTDVLTEATRETQFTSITFVVP